MDLDLDASEWTTRVFQWHFFVIHNDLNIKVPRNAILSLVFFIHVLDHKKINATKTPKT